MRALAQILFALAALSLSLAGPASASPNNGPDNAANVSVGVPFTGSWPGTPVRYGTETFGFTHWWRLPGALRAGDKIQMAVDNRQGAEMALCLVAPVDEFGAQDALARCDTDTRVGNGRQERLTMTYGEATGQPFLVTGIDWESCFECDVATGSGNYTITIEQITTLVNIGLALPPSLPSTFTLVGNLTYGDNTPAADGIPAFLQWRPVAPRGDTKPFANLIAASSSGGTVTFAGAIPTGYEGRKIQLRACVAQPGSPEVRCAEATRVAVTPSPCSVARSHRLAYARSVHRLKRRLHRHGSHRAKRRLRRRLAVAKRLLAKARRRAAAQC